MPLINPPPYTPRTANPPRAFSNASSSSNYSSASNSSGSNYSSGSNNSSSRGGRSLGLSLSRSNTRSDSSNNNNNNTSSLPSTVRTGRKRSFFFRSLSRNSGSRSSGTRRLFRLIKSENAVISAYENAGRERIAVASQLSEWGGEHSGHDESVSDLSDKLGILLTALGTLEMHHAQSLEDARALLKAIRNTESSVQPSRDHKASIVTEIARLRYKSPGQVSRIEQLEQELVRAEAENMVAEAQLCNITRGKLKEAYAVQFDAVIERGEKAILLARYGRQLLALLDDTPLVPGEKMPTYTREKQARKVLQHAETSIREWKETVLQQDEIEVSPIHTAPPIPLVTPSPHQYRRHGSSHSNRPNTSHSNHHSHNNYPSTSNHPAYAGKSALPYSIPGEYQHSDDEQEMLGVHPAHRTESAGSSSKGKGKGKGKGKEKSRAARMGGYYGEVMA